MLGRRYAGTVHTRLVYAGDVGQMHHVWCDEDREASTDDEESAVAQIVYPRSGVFVREVRGEAVVAHAAVAVFFNRGEVGRVRHPDAPAADSSTTLTPTEAVLDGLVDTSGQLPAAASAVDARGVVDHARLRRRVSGEHLDRLEIDDLMLSLMERAAGVRRVDASAATTSSKRYRRLANHAAEALATRFHENVGLGELATAAGASPFEVSRAVNRTFGRTISELRTVLRVGYVVDHLNDDGASLADLAAAAGFADQAHLTRAVRQAIGSTPSQLRRHLTALPRKIVQEPS